MYFCANIHVTSIIFLQVFPPSFHELPSPALDLFDLDEHFSSERVRVAQITNKCELGDLTWVLSVVTITHCLYAILQLINLLHKPSSFPAHIQ